MDKTKINELKNSDIISMTAGELSELIAESIKENSEKEYNEYINSLSNDEDDTKIEYPNQVGSIVRSKKTLGIDAFLATSQTQKGQSPLELHAGFSRFVFTIIDRTSGTKKFVHANISPDEIDLIKKKSDLAIERIFNLKNGLASEEKQELSPAYTVAMTSRELAKKTPAQLLNEDPANKSKLESAKKWLSDNLSRYPNNKTQIDAIDDAIKLFDDGKLKKDITVASKIIDLYKVDTKIPNSKKLNAKYNNKTLVYSISICCQPGQDYPFAINIMNCYASTKTTSTGGIVGEMSTAEGKETFSILLTESEWNILITKLDKITRMFEEQNFKELYDIALSKSYFK